MSHILISFPDGTILPFDTYTLWAVPDSLSPEVDTVEDLRRMEAAGHVSTLEEVVGGQVVFRLGDTRVPSH